MKCLEAPTSSKRSEERLGHILETINEAFFALQSDGTVAYINAKGAELLGQNIQTLQEQSLWEVNSGLIGTDLYENIERARLLKIATNFQWEDKRSRLWYQVKAYPSDDLVSVFLTDISEVKKTEYSAKHQALHDSLTGLPNRLSFEQTLNELVNEKINAQINKSTGLLFIDLDGFKSINDTLGHDAGDELLKAAADRLRWAVRSTDVIARLSGDEFVIALPNISTADDAFAVGQKVVNAISQHPFDLHQKRVFMGASIGVSIYPSDSQNTGQLLKNADLAMYEAKKSGKNTVRLFHPDMSTTLNLQLSMEYDLRDAIVNNRIELHYQPRYNVNGQITSVEALARLRSQTGQLIYPDKFISIAEKSGLITSLGKKVLQQACLWTVKQNKTLHNPISVSVNISSVQLTNGDLPKTVLKVLQQSHLPGHLLELEFNETALTQNEERITKNLEYLHAMGVKLVIDNFGSDHSSLFLLHKLPIQMIKLDQAFVKDLPHHHDNVVMVRTVNAVAKSLGLELAAKGVTNQAQREFLIHSGFNELQGYGLSRPLEPQQAEELIKMHDYPRAY